MGIQTNDEHETSTDPFHMVPVGMVCHRPGFSVCVFGETVGASLRMKGNRIDHTQPNHQGPKPESRGMTKQGQYFYACWNQKLGKHPICFYIINH